MPAERVVRVLPDVVALSKTFDYLVPERFGELVRVGTEVRVRLHGRRVAGWVVEDEVTPGAGLELRALESVRGWGPPTSVVELAKWASWRWAGPAASFLKAASSTRVVRSLPPAPPPRSQPGRSEGAATPTSDGAISEAASQEMREVFGGGVVLVRRPPTGDLMALARAASQLLDPGSSEGAGVLVLVPGHEVAGRLAARLRGEGLPVALLPDDWAAARIGGCVVVGTRSGAFAPLSRLSGAIVFDAHDESYVEERAPSWWAWEVVAERSRRDGAPCALVSPCPTLDLSHSRRLVVPSRGFERAGWSTVEVVDRRADDPRTGLFSERVVSVVRWAAEQTDRKVLCVLNRTGRARLLACSACAEIVRCERCSGALELVDGAGGQLLRCRRCGAERPVVCAHCGAGRMKTLRVGVTRAREELEALAGTAVEEVWGPQVSHAGVPTTAATAQVAVGTEALLHRSGPADAVVFLDFDAELLAPRMRASEEALGLLARASRLVARSTQMRPIGGRAPGRVVVQTRLPAHEVLSAAVSADPTRVQEAEEVVRSSLSLPPFSALAQISGAAADDYGAALREPALSHQVEVSGPTDGNWWLKARGHRELCDLLAEVPRPRGRLRVVVDPVRA